MNMLDSQPDESTGIICVFVISRLCEMQTLNKSYIPDMHILAVFYCISCFIMPKQQ